MDGRERDGEVHVGGDAKQRFYDARGYGRPTDGDDLVLAPIEAAHLLARGDLRAVDGDDFEAYVVDRDAGFLPRYLVYADLRGRGFYLSPARAGWVEDPSAADLVVYPRGDGPWDETVAYRVRVVEERDSIVPETVSGQVLAVVDEESAITYFKTDPSGPSGSGTPTPDGVSGHLLGERILVWDPPTSLYEAAFYGQPLPPEGQEIVQLSLVEAAYLAAEGLLSLVGGDAVERIVDRGRASEGDRFDRRLRTYRDLRDRGLVPKTGFKFGADFRVYADFEDPEDVGHSTSLVRVLPPEDPLAPRDLALDVRLAHGVRKSMRFAIPDTDGVTWWTVARLTP